MNWLKRAEHPIQDSHVGEYIWASDGKKVWPVLVTGSPTQFADATMVVYWMLAGAPAAPSSAPSN